MESRPKEVKEKLNDTVESIDSFANSIIDNNNLYTKNEIELAQLLRMSILFYRTGKKV